MVEQRSRYIDNQLNTKAMKTKTFTIPSEQITDFASIISQNDLTARIVEPDDDSIVVEVDYEATDKSAVFEIIELLDDEL